VRLFAIGVTVVTVLGLAVGTAAALSGEPGRTMVIRFLLLLLVAGGLWTQARGLFLMIFPARRLAPLPDSVSLMRLLLDQADVAEIERAAADLPPFKRRGPSCGGRLAAGGSWFVLALGVVGLLAFALLTICLNLVRLAIKGNLTPVATGFSVAMAGLVTFGLWATVRSILRSINDRRLRRRKRALQRILRALLNWLLGGGKTRRLVPRSTLVQFAGLCGLAVVAVAAATMPGPGDGHTNAAAQAAPDDPRPVATATRTPTPTRTPRPGDTATPTPNAAEATSTPGPDGSGGNGAGTGQPGAGNSQQGTSSGGNTGNTGDSGGSPGSGSQPAPTATRANTPGPGTPTATPSPTVSATATGTATSTPYPTLVPEPTSLPTSPPTPTRTPTKLPTNTPTTAPTSTPTNTPPPPPPTATPIKCNTNIRGLDCDGDGVSNGDEADYASNPLNPKSTPENVSWGNSCQDGIDNDADGAADGNDLGCVIF
jgi:hypothetical protein